MWRDLKQPGGMNQLDAMCNRKEGLPVERGASCRHQEKAEMVAMIPGKCKMVLSYGRSVT